MCWFFFLLFALSISGPDGYRNLEEINNEIYRISSIYSMTLLDITKLYGSSFGGKTFEGRSIFCIKISSFEEMLSEYHKPSVLIVAGHSSNEVLPPESALRMAELLGQVANGFVENEDLKLVLEKYIIYIIPILNVDGYNHFFESNPAWRKNRKVLNDDVIGVDLNQNYDIGWEIVEDLELRDTVVSPREEDIREMREPSSQFFLGFEPFSEVETLVVKNMMEEVRFVKVLDLHTYGRFVYFGMRDCFKNSEPKSELVKSMMQEIVSSCGYSSIFPPWDSEYTFIGDMSAFHYLNYSDFSFTAKISLEYQPEFSVAESEEIPKVMQLLTSFLSLEIPVIGRLTKAGMPLPDVRFEVKEIPHLFGEVRRTDKEGYFYVFIPPNVEFSLAFDSIDYIHHQVEYDGVTQTYLEIDIQPKNFWKERVWEGSAVVKVCAVISLLSLSCVFLCVCCRLVHVLCFGGGKDGLEVSTKEFEIRNSSNTTSDSYSWNEVVDFVSDFPIYE